MKLSLLPKLVHLSYNRLFNKNWFGGVLLPDKERHFLALTFSVNYPNLPTQIKLCGNKILGRTAKLIKLVFFRS